MANIEALFEAIMTGEQLRAKTDKELAQLIVNELLPSEDILSLSYGVLSEVVERLFVTGGGPRREVEEWQHSPSCPQNPQNIDWPPGAFTPPNEVHVTACLDCGASPREE